VLPRLAALDAVVIPITLVDLFLLVLLLACGPPPFRGLLVAFKDRLLRERRLRGHKVRALQLEEQGVKELVVVENLREDQRQLKTSSLSESLTEEEISYKFSSLLVGEHWKKLRRWPH
jgi:hypothetical protein